MDRENLLIRDIADSDSFRIVNLNEQLGYKSSIESVIKRLNNIKNDNNYKTYVAEVNSMVVGYIGMSLMQEYEYDGLYVRVLSLVVDEDYRNKGVGSKLLRYAERYAVQKGAIAITLNSGINRKKAHEFYKNNDYKIKGYGFAKRLK